MKLSTHYFSVMAMAMVFLLVARAAVATLPANVTPRLRNAPHNQTRTNTATKPPKWERLPVVERVYGHVDVRSHVRQLEERMPRYQTGVAPDPSHRVPYRNHPYERHGRKLQNVTDLFAPIRIHFETLALDERRNLVADNAAKIDCTCCCWVGNVVVSMVASS